MSYRILLTCEDYFPLMGGAEVCVHALRSEFKKKGHYVTVFTNTMDITDDEDQIIRRVWKFSFAELYIHFSTLWKLIATHDIIHSQYSYRLACICSILCFIQRKPFILTQQGRGIVPEVLPKFFDKFLFLFCQYCSMFLASKVTSTCNEITDLTASFISRSKIINISNGFNADIFYPDPSLKIPDEYRHFYSRLKIFLTVRRLVPKNGIHILIQALSLVRETHPHFHYFAIGEGRHRPIIEKLIQDHCLENNVTLLGLKKNSIIKNYIQYADTIFVPSSAEATSIACIEAMAMQKPLIASRVGGLIDLFGEDEEYGTLVSIYNSELCNYNAPAFIDPIKLRRFADVIIDSMDYPLEYEKKAIKAFSLVHGTYSWHSIAESYLSLYRKYLSS